MIVELSALLDALTHPGMGSKHWAVQLRARVSEALGHMQVLRLTIAMERPPVEVFSAAEALGLELRLASLTVAKSRADRLTRLSVTAASALAQRLAASLKADPPAGVTTDAGGSGQEEDGPQHGQAAADVDR